MMIENSFNYHTKTVIATVFAVIMLMIFCPSVHSDVEEGEMDGWRFSIYRGRWSKTTFLDTILRQETDFRDSWLTVIGVNRKLLSPGPLIHLEEEFNLGKHSGMQNHIEINGMLAFRWKKFPWHRYLNTSVAYGNGLSWAFAHPAIERRSD